MMLARTILLALLTLVVASGCTRVRTSDPPRTATEQFLLSRAARDAVEPLGLEPFAQRRVYVDQPRIQGGTAEDRRFMIGQLRARLLEHDAYLVETPEQAEVILEFRSGGLGIDRNEMKIGAPPNTAAIGIRLLGGPSVNILHPEMNLVHARRQWGASSAAIVSYWKDTGDVHAFAGPYVGRSMLEYWKVILLGSRTISNVATTIDPMKLDTEDLMQTTPTPDE
ncbi:MAG: DUF6655 family protein [Phycisphaeraceae bacterium]